MNISIIHAPNIDKRRPTENKIKINSKIITDVKQLK
jgi:hypothetical protein